jgi:hypothetical protein
MAACERRDEVLASGEVDAELVGEVDDPLGRSAVVESLEALTDRRPRIVLLLRDDNRGWKIDSTPILIPVERF